MTLKHKKGLVVFFFFFFPLAAPKALSSLLHCLDFSPSIAALFPSWTSHLRLHTLLPASDPQLWGSTRLFSFASQNTERRSTVVLRRHWWERGWETQSLIQLPAPSLHSPAPQHQPVLYPCIKVEVAVTVLWGGCHGCWSFIPHS